MSCFKRESVVLFLKLTTEVRFQIQPRLFTIPEGKGFRALVAIVILTKCFNSSICLYLKNGGMISFLCINERM